jgi:hypothetical protein
MPVRPQCSGDTVWVHLGSHMVRLWPIYPVEGIISIFVYPATPDTVPNPPNVPPHFTNLITTRVHPNGPMGHRLGAQTPSNRSKTPVLLLPRVRGTQVVLLMMKW